LGRLPSPLLRCGASGRRVGVLEGLHLDARLAIQRRQQRLPRALHVHRQHWRFRETHHFQRAFL
jgi:hypothetical protein